MSYRSLGSWAAAAAAAALLAGAGAAPAHADGEVVRFATTLGNIDVQLLPDKAPLTVANFLGYVNRGDYNQSIIHRSAKLQSGAPFVIQGGGYRLANGTPTPIPKQASVKNEPGVSNTRGTLAMAKIDQQPDSATDEWFFNLSDTNASLDQSNGGFTVFGRVIAGLDVMDAIAAQPVIDNGSPFNELPVFKHDNPAAPVLPENYIYVTSIRVQSDDDLQAPTIRVAVPVPLGHYAQGQQVAASFTCDDGSGTGVRQCDGPATVDTSTLGKQRFTVSATDNAGNSTAQIVSYFVDPAPDPGPTTSTTPDAPAPTPPAVVTPSTPVLSSPFSGPPPAPALRGTPTTSAAGVVSLKLRCAGPERCVGRAALLADAAAKKHRAKQAKRVTLGSKAYSVAAGRTATVKVKLNAVARRRLRAAHLRLKAYLRLTPKGASARPLKRLTLRVKKPRR